MVRCARSYPSLSPPWRTGQSEAQLPMSVSIPQFWTLAQQSQLLTEEECRRLGGDYQSLRGARRSSNCRALAAWLVSQRALTNYQAKVLLSGRAGPFRFGAYQINDRAGGSSASLRFRAVHLQTHHRVLLHIHTDDPPAAWPRREPKWSGI